MLDTHLYLLFIYLEDGWETEGSRGLLHFNKQNCDGPPRNSKNCRGNRCYNYNFMRFSNHLQLPPCLQYLHGCYLNIKFNLYF